MSIMETRSWRSSLRTWTVQAWWAFRAMRRSRPFWGGLLTLLAGLEILVIPWAPMAVVIRAGAGAMAGYIIGGVLALCGLMLWFQPAQRVFLSIVTLLLGLAAFPFSNLGGFIIGTLLALIGGSLAFAWTPITQVPEPAEEPTDIDDERQPDDERQSDDIRETAHISEPSDGVTSRQVAGAFLLIVTVTLTGLMASSLSDQAEAAPGVRQPYVASTQSELQAHSQRMSGLSYKGVTSLPTRNGSVRALEFTMKTSQSASFEMHTWDGGAGKNLSLKADQLNLEGNVKLYASRFRGHLLGIPVTFTPDFPPPLVLPSMVFFDVEVKLVYMTGDQLYAENLRLRYV